MLTAIVAVVTFFILITIHELGHFIAAKSVGIKVNEFALGMGPAIFRRKKGETEYSLRLLPIGGYCKMEGEDQESESDRAFGNKKKWQRLIVLVAGAFMNIVLGFVLFVAINFMLPSYATPTVSEIVPESNAVGVLEPGDTITEVNGSRINLKADIDFAISRVNPQQPVEIEFERDGQKKSVSLLLTEGDERYIIGMLPEVRTQTFGTRLSQAVYQTVFDAKIVLASLGDLLTGKVAVNDLSGPVGIVSVINDTVSETGSSATAKLVNLFSLVALITINLGVFNLLPIPALDGGRVVFLLIELIRRKKMDPEKEGFIHFVGLMLLLLLMVVVTSSDIFKLVQGWFAP